MVDTFWEDVATMLERAERASSAEEVIKALNEYGPPKGAAAFFPGSGGERQLSDALLDGGWSIRWLDGGYRWKATSPDRCSALEYVEGDVYRRDPAPATTTVEAAALAAVSAPTIGTGSTAPVEVLDHADTPLPTEAGTGI